MNNNIATLVHKISCRYGRYTHNRWTPHINGIDMNCIPLDKTCKMNILC